MEYDFDSLFARLSESAFRRRFHLKEKDKEYVYKKGYDEIERQAREFIVKRLGPFEISNDGKQTPMKGHPVFISQHATATCCRSCLEKWHKIKKGHTLTDEEIDYIVAVLLAYIKSEMAGYEYKDSYPSLFG